MMRRPSNRIAVWAVALSAALAGCTSGATKPLDGAMPARESATIAAGVDVMPADARLFLDGFLGLGSYDPTTDTSPKPYAEHINLALGLINRYVLKPYAKGRFIVTPDSGPGSKTLGRAAAATAAAIAALNLALADAPTDLRHPTVLLQSQLIRIDRSLRGGATLDTPAALATERLIRSLQAHGKTDHLALHPGKTADLSAATVIPRWRVALKATTHRVQALTDSALGALRRYIQRPASKGKFASAKPSYRTQRRAAEALDFAIAQLATAAQACAGIGRLSHLRRALFGARQTLQQAAGLAHRGRLHTREVSSVTSIIDLLERAGISDHLRIHPGHSPTF